MIRVIVELHTPGRDRAVRTRGSEEYGIPKRMLHMIRFALLDSFIGRIVRIRFASNLDVSFDGDTTSQE